MIKRTSILLCGLLCLMIPLSAQVVDSESKDAIEMEALEQLLDFSGPNLQAALEAHVPDYDEQMTLLTDLQQVVKADPNNGTAWLYIASIYRMNREPIIALDAATTAINLLRRNPLRSVAAYWVRSDIHLDLGDVEQAVKDLDSAISFNLGDTDLYWKRADIYFYSGQQDLAKVAYEQLLSIDPNCPGGYIGLGALATDDEERLDYFTKAINLDPNRMLGYSYRAACYADMGRDEEAIDDAIHALSLGQDESSMSILTSMISRGETNLLIDKLQAQTVKEPNGIHWFALLGNAYMSTRAYPDAIKSFLNAQSIDSNVASTPFYINNLVRCYRAMGNHKTALEQVNKMLSLEPDDVDYTFLKAQILHESGKPKAAIRELDKCIAQQPSLSQLYAYRALCHESLKEWDGAIRDYSKALKLQPTSREFVARGYLYSLKGDKRSAQADYRKAINVGDNFFTAYAYYALGQKRKAEEVISSALNEDPDDALLHIEVARVYALIGDKSKAIEYARIALEEGYTPLSRLEQDIAFEALQDDPQFRALIQQYKKSF